MVNYALIVFAIAAIGGLVLAAHVLRDKFAPWSLSILHALLGAVGLILLIILLLQGSAPQQAVISFVLLAIAALGGFFLASFHMRKKLPPKAVVLVIHRPSIAATGSSPTFSPGLGVPIA